MDDTQLFEEAKSAKSLQSSDSSGTKRKRDVSHKFYAVRIGREPGIYHSWSDCQQQVKGFKGAAYKSFASLTNAESFMKIGAPSGSHFKVPAGPSSTAPTKNSSTAPTKNSAAPTKYYAVQNGRTPGVYTDWPSAQAQITGWIKPKQKRFETLAEAEAFVAAGIADGRAVEGVTVTFAQPTSVSRGKDGAVEESKAAAASAAAAAAAAAAGKDKPPPSKKLKKGARQFIQPDENGVHPPGHGPLPADSEDGFDARLVMDEASGKMGYKSEEQCSATKTRTKLPGGTNMLYIWTDGSSLGNGQLGSTAGIGVYFGPGDARNLSAPLPAHHRQTNQRAELFALQRALEITPISTPVTIFSDSSYAINCATTWSKVWVKNNWITSNRKPVENRDVVEEIVNLIAERERVGVSTEMKWLRGHAGDTGNVAADALAVNGAKMAQERARAEKNGAGAFGGETDEDEEEEEEEEQGEFW